MSFSETIWLRGADPKITEELESCTLILASIRRSPSQSALVVILNLDFAPALCTPIPAKSEISLERDQLVVPRIVLWQILHLFHANRFTHLRWGFFTCASD
jgi:hypothetical protein